MHLYSATANKQIRVESLNTAGTASIQLRSDTAITQLKTNGSATGGGLLNEPNRTALQATGDGGISIVAQNASGVIVLGTGGQTERMRINADGNVGIGTSSPSTKLHLENSAANSNLLIKLENDVRAWDVGLRGDASDQFIIRDTTYNTNPFKITAGDNPNNTLVLSAGKVGIGTTSPTSLLHAKGTSGANISVEGTSGVSINIKATSGGQWRIGDGIANSDGVFVIYDYSNSRSVLVATDGNVGIGRTPTTNDLEVEGTASKTASGDWLANSDRRIKKNIKPIENALDTIKKLNPVTFQYTDDYQSKHEVGDKTYWNFIAQEYQEVFPNSVQGSGEMLDNKEILQMESGSAQVVAIKAIQELTKRIEQLEKILEV